MAKKDYYYVALASEGHYQNLNTFVWIVEAKNKTHLNKRLDWMRFNSKKEAVAFCRDKFTGEKIKHA